MATNPTSSGLNYNETSSFSSFKATFPKVPDIGADMGLVGAELIQVMEEHDRLVLHFKGKPSTGTTVLMAGDPVIFEFSSFKTTYKFSGFIHSVQQNNTPQSNNTDVICVSASYVLKNTDQKIYKNVTADQVVSRIASKRGMSATTQRHPRVRKTIVQAGQSDWQLLRRLAKQTGFALRSEGASITFVSKSKIYDTKKASAPYFTYIDATDLGVTTKYERSYGGVIYFTPDISDSSPELGSRVDRIITGINSQTSTVIDTMHPLKDFSVESKGVVVPGEAYFE